MDVSVPSPSYDFPQDEDLRLTPSRSAHCRRTLSLAKSARAERTTGLPPDHQSVYRRVTSVGTRVSPVRADAHWTNRCGVFRNWESLQATSAISRKRHELSPATGASPVPFQWFQEGII
jgi:hypothetical protein